MRAYLAKLSPTVRMLLVLPLILLAYPAVTMLLPALLRAMVPEVVRSIWRLM